MLLGQVIDIWPNEHGRTRGFHALDNSCNFLIRWRRQVKRNIRFLWFGHPRKNWKHFHAIYTFKCVHKVGSTLINFERRKQRCRVWKLFCHSTKSFTYFIIVVSSNDNNNNWIIIITKIIMITIKVLLENIWFSHPWKLSGDTVIPRRRLALLAFAGFALLSKNNVLTFYFLFWTKVQLMTAVIFQFFW